jgi:hypothetical protein
MMNPDLIESDESWICRFAMQSPSGTYEELLSRADAIVKDQLQRRASRLQSKIPEDAVQQQDGFFYAIFDGKSRRLCEDCWRPIPSYIDFPSGLVSPESDGDPQGNHQKRRRIQYHDKEVWEQLRKAVCLDCYYEAFARFYPGAEPPELSNAERREVVIVVPEPEEREVYIPEPKT